MKNEKLNDLDKLNLKGNVKLLTISEFEALKKFGEIVEGKNQGFRNSTIKFNEDGNIVELHNCMIFDENFFNSFYLQVIGTKKYSYDGIKLKEQNYYDTNGDLVSRWKYSYDKNGNITEEILYDNNGIEKYKYENEYDNRNNLIETLQYSENSIEYRHSYSYDSENKKIKYFRTNYVTNEVYINNTYTYDAKDKLSEIKSRTGVIEKFENGNKVQLKNSENNYTYEYKFDENDNWIKMIEYENEKPIRITKREIEYN
ncbi:hypothetical protein C3B48_05185 [Flavobacterium columnare]|nr:hypothetical protein [Flavobacterium columnare]